MGEGPSIAGRRLGHFELIESAGAGGMAAVLKARDLELGRVVALKILPPEAALDAENVTRFKQEARAAAKLDHENVARVYFCGEDQGLHFIAFEFVEGVTLRALIDRRGPLPAAECVRYMIQVAAGLHHAAERGVVHRDIKPSNILITPDGRAKIVDMGLARHLEAGSVNGGVTQSGVTLGTFDYISPEQALDPRRADVRSDIYSLGCAFYHALTGRPPVSEGTAAKKLHAHQYVNPLDPRELNPSLPDELAAVLSRMMAKNPDHRYQSPTDLIAHLKALAAKLRLPLDAVITDSSVMAVPPDARLLPELPRVRLGSVVAAAAVVIAAVALAGSSNWSGPTAPPPPGLPVAPNDPAAGIVTNPVPVPTGTAPDPRPPDDNRPLRVETAEELVRALAAGTRRIMLVAGEYDLRGLDAPVLFRGPALELVGTTTNSPGGAAPLMTRIRMAPPPASRSMPTSGLIFQADSVVVRGIRFEFAAPESDATEPGGGEFSGLTVLDATQVTLSDCDFLPTDQARRGRVATASIAAPPGDAVVRIKVERCLFGPGGHGLRVPRRSDITVEDSGFGPQESAILVRGDVQAPDPTAGPDQSQAPPTKPTTVRLDRSTFMVDTFSAVIEADSSATRELRVTAGYCVFAPPDGTPDYNGDGFFVTGRNARVVRIQGDIPEEYPTGVRFDAPAGQANVYYRVDPVSTATRNYSFEECKTLAVPITDPSRSELKQRPWDPEGGSLSTFTSDDPYKAFRLRIKDPGADPSLFVTDTNVWIVGARFSRDGQSDAGRGRVYSGPPAVYWPPPNLALVALARRKVWVPEKDETDLAKGEYKDLIKLLRDAKSGDEILIRHTGVRKIEQHVIEPPKPGNAADRTDFHLTFKPDKGYHPVLTPDEAVNLLDFSMFRLREGRVTFEGLHFVIKPGLYQESVAAVTLVAGRGCTFRNCIFTLGEEDGKISTAVALKDPDKEMKMDGPGRGPTPRVVFENCLIRGKGRGVWVPASRPFELSLDQSITALNGPVVYAEAAAGRDPAGTNPSIVRLSRVTALLGGPLVELHAGRVGEMRVSGLVPTTVIADGCLFAAVPGAGRGIVEVTGTEIDPTDTNRVLKWDRGDDPNRFANFDPSVPVALIDRGDGSIQDWDWNTWTRFAGEVVKPFGKVTFADGPEGLKDLATLRADDVAVKIVDFPDVIEPKPADAGADPDKVARPVDEPPEP